MAKTLKDFVTQALETVAEVEVSDLDRLTAEGYTLLDVREGDEFAAGHIPGAIFMPRGFLEVRADLEHPKRDPRMADRSQRLVCYCGGGHRSALAAQSLQQMGFSDVVSLRGGWTAYSSADLPVEVS